MHEDTERERERENERKRVRTDSQRAEFQMTALMFAHLLSNVFIIQKWQRNKMANGWLCESERVKRTLNFDETHKKFHIHRYVLVHVYTMSGAKT